MHFFYSILQRFKLWRSSGLFVKKTSFLRLSLEERQPRLQFQSLSKEESQKLPSKYGPRFIKNKKLLNKAFINQVPSWAPSNFYTTDIFSTFLAASLTANQLLSYRFFRKNFLYFNLFLTNIFLYQLIIFYTRLQIAAYVRYLIANLINLNANY